MMMKGPCLPRKSSMAGQRDLTAAAGYQILEAGQRDLALNRRLLEAFSSIFVG